MFDARVQLGLTTAYITELLLDMSERLDVLQEVPWDRYWPVLLT